MKAAPSPAAATQVDVSPPPQKEEEEKEGEMTDMGDELDTSMVTEAVEQGAK